MCNVKKHYFFVKVQFSRIFENFKFLRMKMVRISTPALTLVLSFITIFFSGCLKDKCEQTYHYTTYTPVYMSEDELRSAIKMLPAEDIVTPGKIFYMPPYLFVNELNKGIHIINNADPSNPQNVSFINIPGNLDLAVRGNILYADSYIDMVALDISDPLNVIEVDRTINVFPGRVYEGWTSDPALGVVVDFIPHDTLITETCTSDPSNFGNQWEGDFFLVSSDGGGNSGSSAATPGYGVAGSMTRFAITGNFLYCVTPASMELFDITDPSSPQQGSSITTFANAETIFPYDNYLFIGSTTGVLIYNNVVPESPVFVSQLLHMTSCDPVVVNGTTAYSTLRSGTTCGTFDNDVLDIIDLTDINVPVLIKSYNMTGPYGLGIDGQTLFICDGDAGLKMYDVTNPLNISLLQTVDIANPYDVIPIEGLLIVVTENAILQYDYSSGTMELLSVMNVIRDI